MIIGIDGNEANVTKRVGISEFAYQLLMQFYSIQTDVKFVIYLKDSPLKSLPEANANWEYRILRPGKFWTQWRLPLDLYTHKEKPDVFFSPTHYAPRFSPVPTVVSVMDLSFLRFPELFTKKDLYQLENWTKYSVKKAKRVLTISDSSRSDIIKTYNISEKKVVTVYPGIKETVSLKPRVYAMNQLQAKYHFNDKYILFVGTLQPRKNITRLIEAFSMIKDKDVDLVVIGKKGWLYEEILAAPERHDVLDRVKFLEGVNDEELSVFYKHAQVYVLPSLYEGFGLPVLEAMGQGCPVITSNISSLPEAGGDAALYVDPEDASDIAKKIEKVLGDKELRSEMIAKGKKQVEKFSWEKAAKETLDVLKEVGGK